MYVVWMSQGHGIKYYIVFCGQVEESTCVRVPALYVCTSIVDIVHMLWSL